MVTNKMINILSILLDGVFLIILAIFFYLGLPITSITSTPITSAVVVVPQGSISAIITQLGKNGWDITQFDRHILRLLGTPQSGVIDIGYAVHNGVITKGDFLYALTSAKAAQESVTLIPGETLHFFIIDIGVQLDLNEDKLLESYLRYAPYEEGVILPNTYKIHANATEDSLMRSLIQQSLAIHEDLARKYLGRYEQDEWFRHIAMASIIQKEAANTQEMPIIAAVIYNRLKLNMPLQMDGSLNYGKYSHSKVTPERIRNDSSPFNTYRNKGIPPIPVGSASIEAIKAVFEPAQVDYLYFVRNKNGTHSFSKTFKEHRENFDK